MRNERYLSRMNNRLVLPNEWRACFLVKLKIKYEEIKHHIVKVNKDEIHINA